MEEQAFMLKIWNKGENTNPHTKPIPNFKERKTKS